MIKKFHSICFSTLIYVSHIHTQSFVFMQEIQILGGHTAFFLKLRKAVCGYTTIEAYDYSNFKSENSIRIAFFCDIGIRMTTFGFIMRIISNTCTILDNEKVKSSDIQMFKSERYFLSLAHD